MSTQVSIFIKELGYDSVVLTASDFTFSDIGKVRISTLHSSKGITGEDLREEVATSVTSVTVFIDLIHPFETKKR